MNLAITISSQMRHQAVIYVRATNGKFIYEWDGII